MIDREARRGAERIEHILDAAAEPAEIVAEAAGLAYSDPGGPVALRLGGLGSGPVRKVDTPGACQKGIGDTGELVPRIA